MQCDGNLAGRNLIGPNGHVARRPPQRLVAEGDGTAGTRGNSGKPPNEPQARDGGSRRRHDRIGQVQSHHRRRIRHASKGSQRGQTRFGSFLVVVLPPRSGSLEPLRLLSVSRFRFAVWKSRVGSGGVGARDDRRSVRSSTIASFPRPAGTDPSGRGSSFWARRAIRRPSLCALTQLADEDRPPGCGQFRDLAPGADSRFGRSRSRRAVACGVLIAHSSRWPHASLSPSPARPR